jgi:Mg2+/Co2+ transporter CorC
VSARLSVEELEELFDVGIDAEDVETVGGLLAHQLGKVPIAGSEATVEGLRLTAENLTGRRNRIGTVRVQRIDGVSEISVAAPRTAAPEAEGGEPGSGDGGATASGRETRSGNRS